MIETITVLSSLVARREERLREIVIFSVGSSPDEQEATT
jgi:hypothetical protein